MEDVGWKRKGSLVKTRQLRRCLKHQPYFPLGPSHSSCCVSQQPTASFHVLASQRAQKKSIHHLYAIAPLKRLAPPTAVVEKSSLGHLFCLFHVCSE